jgi:hypothetical protein
MTALSVINRALRSIGVLASGETAPASEVQDALTALNAMIDSWRLQRLTVPTYQTADLACAAVASYTIGPDVTDDVVTDPRPSHITSATFIPAGSAFRDELPMEVLTEQKWRELTPKNLTSTIPTQLYYSPTAPSGTIYLWPVATGVVGTVVLHYAAPLAKFANHTTDYDLPPGYEEALMYNLAARLAPEFGRALDGNVAFMARESLGNVKRANIRPAELRCDPALLGYHGGANILTGE